MRTERDGIGVMQLENDALYGIQTARARENFSISGRAVSWELLRAMLEIKWAAAQANAQTGRLSQEKADAIAAACEQALRGAASDAWITDALQGGAGTSTHMNVCEVTANLALLYLGHKPGEYQYLHPLDDVNLGQSTNDVYPTALRIACIRRVRCLSDACSQLQEAFQEKEREFADVMKLGRTQLMDALPVTLGQEFGAYAQAVSRDRWRIYKIEERLRQVNLGGTAVGNATGAGRQYTFRVIEILRERTEIGLARAEYPMDLTQNNDVFCEVSGLLKALAVNLMKISGDLRLMASGPNGGLGEITLQTMQAGSTIMPGKINPVIPEMTTQVAIRVMANDTAVCTAAACGNLELNAFLPLIADSLLESLTLLTQVLPRFTACIRTLSANRDVCREHLDRSAVLATALSPYIGYDAAARLVRECRANPERLRTEIQAIYAIPEKELEQILSYRTEMHWLSD